MFIKKKKFKQNQLFLKKKFKTLEKTFLLKKSLLKNHYNHYLLRLSFTFRYDNELKDLFFFSRQKLICLQLLDKKVPSSKYLFSRFFLNKQLNSIKISNTSK